MHASLHGLVELCTVERSCRVHRAEERRAAQIFHVEVIDQGCPTEDPASYSPVLEIEMPKWGDLTGIGCGDNLPGVVLCPPPDGHCDIGTDVTATIDTFKNILPSIGKARGDILPPNVDFLVGFAEATATIDAFCNQPYPYGPSVTDPCPGGETATARQNGTNPPPRINPSVPMNDAYGLLRLGQQRGRNKQ